MNYKNAFCFLVSLLLTSGVVLAQQAAPAPPGSPSMPAVPGEPLGAFSLFIEGGSFLGVYAEDVNKENMGRYGLREVRGVGITQVVKDSPAEKAGIKKDDVILRFDGDSVTSVRKLNRLVSEVAPDQTVRLGISRGGSEQEVSVTIGKRDQSLNAFHRLEGLEGFRGMEGFKGLEGLQKLDGFKGLEGLKDLKVPGAQVWKWEGQGPGNDGFAIALGNNRRMGVSTVQLTKQLADYFGIANGKGVLVTAVSDDSPAAKAGLKAGDVITTVDGEMIEGPGDLSRAINKNKDGDVTVVIIRDKKQRTIKVTPEKAQGQVIRPGRIANQRVIRDQMRDAIRRGAAEGRVVIPSIALPTIPAVNISLPQIELPVIPEIRIVIPRTPKVRVIKTPSSQPI
ncbi:MAG: PDZ domain-containing protein [Acidobacteriota bacterium]|nr:PDZ domain-containing protein [Acidobacteriota bacterium]